MELGGTKQSLLKGKTEDKGDRKGCLQERAMLFTRELNAIFDLMCKGPGEWWGSDL